MAKGSAFRFAAALTSASIILSSTAAVAAPVPTAGVDPLVAVSAMGTQQSRAAVCGGASHRIGTNAVITNASLRTGADCQLPVTKASMAMTAAQSDGRTHAPFNWVWVMVGGALVLVPLIAILASNGHSNGNLQPVSPP